MHAKRHGQTRAAGVDLGGTWARVAILEDGRLVRRCRRAANGIPELRTFLLTLSSRSERRRLGGLVVASRGVWTESERRALERRLSGLATRIEVISDVEAALLGALGERVGVLVLAGTGSIVLARNGSGRWARTGG